MITRLIILFSTFCVGTAAVHGAGGESPKSGLRITCLGEWKGRDLYIKDPKKEDSQGMKKLNLADMRYSVPMNYPSAQPIKFFHKTENEDAPYAMAFSVEIPAKVRQPLILIIPRGDEVDTHVFDTDPKGFGYGSYMVVNIYGKKVEVIMNEDAHQLEPDGQHVFAAAKEKKVAAQLRVLDAETEKVMFSSMMMRRENKRCIIFLTNDFDDLSRPRLKTRTLVDFKPSLKSK